MGGSEGRKVRVGRKAMEGGRNGVTIFQCVNVLDKYMHILTT